MSTTHPSKTYTARWILPGHSAPREHATIEVCDGVVSEIAARRGGEIDLGDVMLLPGLINSHTHLEFSGLSTPLQPAVPFTDWIRSLIQDRLARRGFGPHAETAESKRRLRDDLRSGLSESRALGTTTVGEIATYDLFDSQEIEAFDASGGGPRVVAFREILGLRLEQRESQLAIARRHLESARVYDSARANHDVRTKRLIAGLSPHAPYSVHPELFRDLVALARDFNVPLAMHLGETRAERQLLESGSGEFVDFLRERGVWQAGTFARGTTILDYLRELSPIPSSLAVHGNYLNAAEIDFLAKNPQIAVVYCPRTHAFFQHAAHPWRELMSRGASVVLGTDSRASNPDLSLWNELKWLARRSVGLTDLQLLELATVRAAQALRLQDVAGKLQPGSAADLIVLRPGKGSGHPLFSDDSQIIAVMIQGELKACSAMEPE